MTLILHRGAQEIDYVGLRRLDTPPATSSHVPIEHFRVVDLVKSTLFMYGHEVTADHHGVTEQLGTLEAGDELLLEDPWGTIQYKGPGTFIAGGAGVTPFIAILRQLAKDGRLAGNTLLLSNKTAKDIILRDEFEAMKGLRRVFTVTHERAPALESRRIDRAFLQDHVADFGQHFYVCGPKQMVEDLKGHLEALGARADAVVFEE